MPIEVAEYLDQVFKQNSSMDEFVGRKKDD
jgi:hypothetical protein